MRTLTDHVITKADNEIGIHVTDEPGSGNASHRYEVSGFNLVNNMSTEEGDLVDNMLVLFQNGPVLDNKPNGITHEILLAIVADRLRSFQAGPFACKANENALQHVEEAMHWLQQRTLERIRRGVEGKEVK